MKKLYIYEPAMCCPTGLCGVGVDNELLRISSAINTLEKNGVKCERFNLSGSPGAFTENSAVNKILSEKGMDALPVTMVDDEIVKSGGYPSNEELAGFLKLSPEVFKSAESSNRPVKITQTGSPSGGCCC